MISFESYPLLLRKKQINLSNSRIQWNGCQRSAWLVRRLIV